MSAAILLALAACEEDPSQIGGDILPGSDFEKIVSTDTFNIKLLANYIDTTKTSGPGISYLGKIQNPYFGQTSADFVTQMWLYESWPERGLISVDSIKISLQVSNLIGTMTGINTINIYEIDEFLSEDSIYYSNRNVPAKQLLGSFFVSDIVDADSILNYHLPVSFGEELLRDTTKLFLSNDTADFRSYFNGLYFEYVQSDDNHMIGFNLLDAYSTIYLYYTDMDTINRIYTFLINDKCVRYNRYLHDFGTADADKKIKYINLPQMDTLAYIQSFAGVYTTVEIPGLAQIRDSMMPVAINKARIYLPIYLDDTYYTEDMVPETIAARYVDSTGVKRYLADYSLDPSFLDGTYDYINNRYEMNIVNFVQQYLDGDIPEPKFELFLQGASDKNTIIRANGAVNSPVLEIVYTDLK